MILILIANSSLGSTARAAVFVSLPPAENGSWVTSRSTPSGHGTSGPRQRRRCWEGLWRECYTYALPQRGTGFGTEFRPGANPVERLFDGTALDGSRAARRIAARRIDAALVAMVRPDPGPRHRPDRTRRGRRGAGPRDADHPGPLRPIQFRGRDPSVLSRSGHRGQRDPAVRGGADRRHERVPAERRADERNRFRGGPRWPDRWSFPRAQPASRPASGARSPGPSCKMAAAGCEAAARAGGRGGRGGAAPRWRLRLLRAARR